MPHDLQVLRIGEGHETVGLVEVPDLVRRPKRGRLHAILGRHMAELGRQQRPVFRAIGDPVSQADARRPR